MASASLQHKDSALLGALFLIALAVRIAWASYSKADPFDRRFDDSLFYHLQAIGLRETHSYLQAFTGLPTAQWPPGNPVFLAGVYGIFGTSVLAAKLANAFLGAATVAAVYVLGRQLFDRPSAVLGAVFLAVMPGQVFFTGILWSEVLFAFLFLCALVGVAALPHRPQPERLRWALAVGVLAATAAYVRETGLSVLPIAALYWGWSFRSWRPTLGWTGGAVLVTVLLIAPWAVRNTVRLEGPVMLSSSTGTNFWRGHHEGATGGFDPVEPLFAKSKPRTSPGGEADAHQRGMREGLKFLVRHPVDETKLAGSKTRLLYEGDTIGLELTEAAQNPFVQPGLRQALRFLANAVYYLVLVLAGLAMVRWALGRGSEPLLPVVAVATLTFGYVAFWGDARFHFPMVPLLCLLAGWAVAGLWRGSQTSRRRRA